MRGLGYTRVSTQEQIDGTSLKNQEDQIRAYAVLKNIDLVDILVDAGVSGGRPISERPQGRTIASMIERGEIDCLVITKLDRAFRNTVDCLQMVELWDKTNIGLHVIDMGGSSVDTKSAAGRFMLTVLVAAAEMERARTNERCREGRAARRRDNGRLGELPYGFDVDPSTNNLVENHQEQEAIRLVVQLKAEGYSNRAIAREMDRENYRTKRQGAWTGVQVASILKRVYG